MENKKGEKVVVKLEPMIKMEVEKEPTLGSVEKEKRISFWNRLKTKSCKLRITRKMKKEIILNSSSRKSIIKNSIQKSQKLMGKEISMRTCILIILVELLGTNHAEKKNLLHEKHKMVEKRIWFQRKH